MPVIERPAIRSRSAAVQHAERDHPPDTGPIQGIDDPRLQGGGERERRMRKGKDPPTTEGLGERSLADTAEELIHQASTG